MTKKATKRALLMSVMSLILCFAMLLGTTYAWFTDSVTSANNVIQSGKLDIALDYWNGDDWFTVEGSSMLFDETALWEPGYAHVVYLRLENKGTLALRYQLGVNIVEDEGKNAAGETFKLSDYIYMDVVEGVNGETDAYETREEIADKMTEKSKISEGYAKASNLEAKSGPVYFALIVYMPTWVGNEANYGEVAPKITLGVNVLATQLGYENDAFGNDYDAMANGYYNVQYGFNSEQELLSFTPVAGDAAASGLSLNGGKAQVDSKGAWVALDGANLMRYAYTVEYDMDITALSAGESITVDAGQTDGWNSTPIVLERGSTVVYYGTWKNELLGTLEGTVLHVTHTYAMNDAGKLEISTVISDGEDSVSYTGAFATDGETQLYWDIFGATESGKALMDNFSVSTEEVLVIPEGFEEVADGVYSGEDGKTYALTNANGFVWMEAQSDSFFAGKTVKLLANIDCAGMEFKPITCFTPEYPVTFDGQNYTVSNVNITANPRSTHQAMFNGLMNIKNLKVDGATVQGCGYTGVITGNFYGNIDNCHVSNATVTDLWWGAAIFSGFHGSGNVTNCSATNCSVTGPTAAGILVGVMNETGGTRRLDNCVVTNCKVNMYGNGDGSDWDTMFALAVGLINIENSNVYITGGSFSGNEVKGAPSDKLYGYVEAGTTVHVD